MNLLYCLMPWSKLLHRAPDRAAAKPRYRRGASTLADFSMMCLGRLDHMVAFSSPAAAAAAAAANHTPTAIASQVWNEGAGTVDASRAMPQRTAVLALHQSHGSTDQLRQNPTNLVL
jgi:hypothetical protein